MNTIDVGINALALSDDRVINAKALINESINIDNESLIDFTVTENFGDGTNLTIGATYSNNLSLNMYNLNNLPEITSIRVWVGLQPSEDGAVSWVQLGVFYPSDVTSPDNYQTLNIVGYDAMTLMESDYTPTITMPNTISNIVYDIATQTSVSYEGSLLPTITVDQEYDDEGNPVAWTYRTWLGYIAGLIGKNAIINRNNEIEFRWFEAPSIPDITEEQQNLGGFVRNSQSNNTITELISGTEESPITSGSSGMSISFMNPLMTQADLDSIGLSVLPYSFMPCSLAWRCDPQYRVGDLLTVSENEDDYDYTLTVSDSDYEDYVGVELSTFVDQVVATGTYVFDYNSGWELSGTPIDPLDYGLYIADYDNDGELIDYTGITLTIVLTLTPPNTWQVPIMSNTISVSGGLNGTITAEGENIAKREVNSAQTNAFGELVGKEVTKSVATIINEIDGVKGVAIKETLTWYKLAATQPAQPSTLVPSGWSQDRPTPTTDSENLWYVTQFIYADSTPGTPHFSYSNVRQDTTWGLAIEGYKIANNTGQYFWIDDFPFTWSYTVNTGTIDSINVSQSFNDDYPVGTYTLALSGGVWTINGVDVDLDSVGVHIVTTDVSVDITLTTAARTTSGSAYVTTVPKDQYFCTSLDYDTKALIISSDGELIEQVVQTSGIITTTPLSQFTANGVSLYQNGIVVATFTAGGIQLGDTTKSNINLGSDRMSFRNANNEEVGYIRSDYLYMQNIRTESTLSVADFLFSQTTVNSRNRLIISGVV